MIAIRNVIVGITAVGTTLLVGVLAAAAKDRIIFTSNGPSAAHLFIANADGTDERRLLSTDEFDYSPSFSSDGNGLCSRRSAMVPRISTGCTWTDQDSSG